MTGIRSIVGKTQPLIDDFPQSAITALVYVFQDIYEKGFLVSKSDVILELNRIGRFTAEDTKDLLNGSFINSVGGRLHKLIWTDVLHFCERTYDKLLKGDWEYDYEGTLKQARDYFEKEVNLILEEESINFIFTEGAFARRGKVQTRKAIEGVGFVLSDERLGKVKKYFNKARNAYNQRPNPDVENSVKDALCALEATIEILTGKDASKEFAKTISQLKGNEKGKIPAPIAEALIKIHSYRGSAEGVGHAAINGNRVDSNDAEFILSLIATYITYLWNLFPLEEEVPF